MSTQEDKSAIELVIKEFTDTLSQGRFHQIPLVYTEDGIFMPDGYKSIESRKLASTASKSVIGDNFKIAIQIEQVDVDGNYAFVTATAEVSKGENNAPKTSRDFFTLRKNGEQWKIYRYMFNNFAPSSFS